MKTDSLQAEDPDVILLKKARQEKKVKRYLEDNFQNREGKSSSVKESKEYHSRPVFFSDLLPRSNTNFTVKQGPLLQIG